MSRRPATTSDAATDELPPRSHNQPRPMTPEEVTAYLAELTADLRSRRDEILAGAARFHAAYNAIPDDDVQGKAADFAGGKGAIAAFLKVAEARRVEQKQPFDRAAQAVQGFFTTLVADVKKAQDEIRAKMTAYANKVEEERRAAARKQAEEAAELARKAEAEALKNMRAAEIDNAAQLAEKAEHAQQLAEAKPAEHTRVTGTLGTTASLVATWKLNEAESDLMTLVKAIAAGREPLRYVTFHTVNIGAAIRSEKVREIEGCKIEEVRTMR